MDLEVVGAGFGRTGTLSLKTALDILGYKTYHMVEVFENGSKHYDTWMDFQRRGGGGPLSPEERAWFKAQFAARDSAAACPFATANVNWDAILSKSKYTATVDWPACEAYAVLLQKNPNAKVILSVRPFDRWLQSVRSTIYGMGWLAKHPFWGTLGRLNPLTRKAFQMTTDLIWDARFNGMDLYDPKNEAAIEAIFNAHVDEVKDVVPSDRLLVYHVREGWGPLCAFLGKPVPDVPFPNVNSTDEFRRNMRFVYVLLVTPPLALLAAAATAVWALR